MHHTSKQQSSPKQRLTSRMLGAPRAEKKSTAWLGPRPRGAIVALGARFGSSSPVMSPDAFSKSARLPVSVLPTPSPSPPTILKKGKINGDRGHQLCQEMAFIMGVGRRTIRGSHTKNSMLSINPCSVTGLNFPLLTDLLNMWPIH